MDGYSNYGKIIQWSRFCSFCNKKITHILPIIPQNYSFRKSTFSQYPRKSLLRISLLISQLPIPRRWKKFIYPSQTEHEIVQQQLTEEFMSHAFPHVTSPSQSKTNGSGVQSYCIKNQIQIWVKIEKNLCLIQLNILAANPITYNWIEGRLT